MRDGLSQDKRKKRVDKTKNINIVDNDVEALMRQAINISRFISYYNLENTPDGYFDQFMSELIKIEKGGVNNFVPNGKMDPAQAVIFYFIKQLHSISEHFNERWKNFAQWYLDSHLWIQPEIKEKPRVCIQITKNTDNLLPLNKGFGFILQHQDLQPITYRLIEDVVLDNAYIEKVIAIHFLKEKNIHPASLLNYVSLLRVFNLPNNVENGFIFSDSNLDQSKELGFMISSPSLLLREGNRSVRIQLILENDFDINESLKHLKNKGFLEGLDLESLNYLIINNIFYLQISTEKGWELLNNSTRKEEKSLEIKFSLPEDFPATSVCRMDVHGIESDYPAIKVHLNADAWLYPYSWLKTISLSKIIIQVRVENINNIAVYNELGKVDNSKPFTPFGINSEKGAWLTIGNYEMAIKNTQQLDLLMEWEQLPDNFDGLHGYYKSYNKNINNRSFKVTASYLSDYQWQAISDYYLFDSCPLKQLPLEIAPLSRNRFIKNIDISKMPRIKANENNYDYSIQSKTGFINLSLCSPDIGFGEKHYRSIFADYLMQSASRKSNKLNTPNTPMKPIINRMSMNYQSEDIINLQLPTDEGTVVFYHISPFGYHKIFPNDKYDLVPLIYSLNADSNILLKLSNVTKSSILNLYFDFAPNNKKIQPNQRPAIEWYLGNVSEWEQISETAIIKDNTRNLLLSGLLIIKIPDDLSNSLFDSQGCIWLRISILKNEKAISSLCNVYLNVVEAELEVNEANNGDSFTGELKTETPLADLSEVKPIIFYGGNKNEKKEDAFVRISEYIGHRGRAISSSDFERIVLQKFPEIDKVFCPLNQANNATVSLAVVPGSQSTQENKVWKPQATSRQLLKIEQFLLTCTSARIQRINVVNPLYEEVKIRCKVSFDAQHSTAACQAQLIELLNQAIAPWQQKYQSPIFNFKLDSENIFNLIKSRIYIKELHSLSLIVITSEKDEYYSLNEYYGITIKPSTPFSVFVPSKEHLIHTVPLGTFGINEMTIDDSFIIH